MGGVLLCQIKIFMKMEKHIEIYDGFTKSNSTRCVSSISKVSFENYTFLSSTRGRAEFLLTF